MNSEVANTISGDISKSLQSAFGKKRGPDGLVDDLNLISVNFNKNH